MGIFQSLFTNSKAMININKIIDGLSSEKDIALANKFVESVQNATQYQRDEIFKLFTEIKGKTKEEVQKAFFEKINSDDVKKILRPDFNVKKNTGTNLNIISDKNNVVKKVDSRTYYPRYDYDQEIRCPGSGREKAYREELRCPGIGRERAYREELRCPGIGRELAYREYLSGRPDV